MVRRLSLLVLPVVLALAFAPARAYPTDPIDVYQTRGIVSFPSDPHRLGFSAQLTRAFPSDPIHPGDPFRFGALSFSGRLHPADPIKCLVRASGRFSISWSSFPPSEFNPTSTGTMSIYAYRSTLAFTATIKAGQYAGGRLLGALAYPSDPHRCRATGSLSGVTLRV